MKDDGIVKYPSIPKKIIKNQIEMLTKRLKN